VAGETTGRVISNSIIPLLEKSIKARAALFDAQHETAFRLFNGFTEGEPNLVIDLYASTVVIHNYADDPVQGKVLVEQAAQFLQDKLVWLRTGFVKMRNANAQEIKRGQLLFGEKTDTRIKEHVVWYSIDLTMSRDTSFYLDTRNLRKWLIEHMQGKTVLNTFAYTGSLGVSALAGGAKRVVQHDLNPQFLNVAKTSYTLNGFRSANGILSPRISSQWLASSNAQVNYLIVSSSILPSFLQHPKAKWIKSRKVPGSSIRSVH
jgi:23S rRNA (cytosine1962-C5)-methyltransferase